MKRAILFSLLIVIATPSFSNDYKTTLEYRHEYKDGNNKHSDRIKIFLDSGENLGLELDARYNNEDENKTFNDMSMNGSELSIFYYKALNRNLLGLVGLSMDFNPDGLVYVPYVRLNYSFDSGFRTQARYKWKLWDYADTTTDIRSKIQELDTWVAYASGNWDFQMEMQYWQQMESNAISEFDNGNSDYLYNFRVMYAFHGLNGKKWRPFVEVGNVRESRTTDNRQTRYRVGIKYTW
ncbi:putative outer membrane protein [Psychromonas sp. CNPT3]|uniref:oligogalacturonate-specific porin KdgM family protein n=1 Tax=Psychromonas sp. CNPT3 TaxID=314282 RepID=UPI00006E5892|nr:oligogalacturonate-specific porin KdgM family protein [Psychromonas sp. CNPT3]AGH82373.1 putative outer membrane protein [Psychromonas sp. CNPT3]